ncbi:MAG: hypothetical protein ABIT09_11400 [Croceibacterium sp.]
MTGRAITDRALDIAAEVEAFAALDHPTRRFIAYALTQVPELAPLLSQGPVHAGNAPLPFAISEAEAAERAIAYRAFGELRAANGRGPEGQNQRRMAFGALLVPARVDLKWTRLTSLAAFLFLYQRLAGPMWRQLLPLAWNEAALERKRRIKRGTQLPLDARLRDDAMVPDALRDDPAPWFFPSLADADAVGGAPLLAGL